MAENPWEQQHPPSTPHRVAGWRGEGWGQPKPLGRAFCPLQASPLHSQPQPGGPQGQDQALKHSSAAVVPEPCSAPPQSQREMAHWGCPCPHREHPGTPSPRTGLAGWRLPPAPGHLQDLQPPQGTESPILDAADLILVQLPAEEGQREHCWDSPGRERPVAPDASCRQT